MVRRLLLRFRPLLSVTAARIAQFVYAVGSRSAVSFRVVERFLAPRAPRVAGSYGADLERRIRPVQMPQRGRGTLQLDRLPHSGREVARLALRARAKQRVVVPPDANADSATAIIAMAAAGVPLHAPHLSEGVREQLGEPLATLLAAPSFEDTIARELHSVRLRRAALPLHWSRRSGSPSPNPSVSVLLASQRPQVLLGAVEQLAQQSWQGTQLIVGLHGAAWGARAEAAIAERWRGDLAIVRVPEGANLGDVLNELSRRSDGSLVSKWDDDDWYGPDHLLDLVLAYTYSGAEVVGKAAEFVYLERANRTLRRFAVGAESYRWTLAGGTMLTSREWLDHVGGWPSAAQGVDQSFLELTRAAGGEAYRTHGFQYVLRRGAGRRHGHTWEVDDEYFLATASAVRPGLDLTFADVKPA